MTDTRESLEARVKELEEALSVIAGHDATGMEFECDGDCALTMVNLARSALEGKTKDG